MKMRALRRRTKTAAPKFKKTLIWSLLHDAPHPGLPEEEQTIKAVMPLISALFPGINYFSTTGFGTVRKECLKPALQKLFPDLASTTAGKVESDETVEVSEFLPSKGYEWQDSLKWKNRFKKLVAA